MLDNFMETKLTEDAEADKLQAALEVTGLDSESEIGLQALIYIKCNRLEKLAEPTAPVWRQEPPCYDGRLVCPGCGKPIENVWSSRVYQPHFCHYCGQALDWRHPDDND